MASKLSEERMLHATLCEIERGLFHISYRLEGGGLGRQYLPRYEVGTCASDAQRRVEQRARECGYEGVVWEAAFVEPPVVRPSTKEGARLGH